MNIIKNKEILKDALNLYLDVITPYDFENIDDYNKKNSRSKRSFKWSWGANWIL